MIPPPVYCDGGIFLGIPKFPRDPLWPSPFEHFAVQTNAEEEFPPVGTTATSTHAHQPLEFGDGLIVVEMVAVVGCPTATVPKQIACSLVGPGDQLDFPTVQASNEKLTN
jgi:hypothetical protein